MDWQTTRGQVRRPAHNWVQLRIGGRRVGRSGDQPTTGDFLGHRFAMPQPPNHITFSDKAQSQSAQSVSFTGLFQIPYSAERIFMMYTFVLPID